MKFSIAFCLLLPTSIPVDEIMLETGNVNKSSNERRRRKLKKRILQLIFSSLSCSFHDENNLQEFSSFQSRVDTTRRTRTLQLFPPLLSINNVIVIKSWCHSIPSSFTLWSCQTCSLHVLFAITHDYTMSAMITLEKFFRRTEEG